MMDPYSNDASTKSNSQIALSPCLLALYELKNTYDDKIKEITKEVRNQPIVHALEKAQNSYEKALLSYLAKAEMLWIRSTGSLPPERQREILHAGLRGERKFVSGLKIPEKKYALKMLDAQMDAIIQAIGSDFSAPSGETRKIMEKARRDALSVLAEATDHDTEVGSSILQSNRLDLLQAAHREMAKAAPRIQRNVIEPETTDQRNELSHSEAKLKDANTAFDNLIANGSKSERAAYEAALKTVRMKFTLGELSDKKQVDAFLKPKTPANVISYLG